MHSNIPQQARSVNIITVKIIETRFQLGGKLSINIIISDWLNKFNNEIVNVE